MGELVGEKAPDARRPATLIRATLRALTSRRAATALMVFVAVSGAVGAWVPQRSNLTAEGMAQWESANPSLARIALPLGLDRLFSSWWYLAALALFSAMLLPAVVRMLRASWRSRSAGPAARTVRPGVRTETVAARALALGYRERQGCTGERRFVRHGIGVWAPAVLHLGMLVALLAALAAGALTSRAVLDLAEGEVRVPGDPYLTTETGLLGGVPELGVPVRFDGVTTASWPDGSLRSIEAVLSMPDEAGAWKAYTSAVNAPLHYAGHILYAQPAAFGDAAFLKVMGPGGAEHLLRMDFAHAPADTARYASVSVDGERILHGRWDPHGVKGSVLLALRPESDPSAQPVALAEGKTVRVGQYDVTLAGMRQWARFIVVRPRAIGVLFGGFGIIAAGSLMLYLWVPRELVVRDDTAGVRYGWRVPRLGRAYLSERDAILGPLEERA